MEVQGWLAEHCSSAMTDPGVRGRPIPPPRLLSLSQCLLARCSGMETSEVRQGSEVKYWDFQFH